MLSRNGAENVMLAGWLALEAFAPTRMSSLRGLRFVSSGVGSERGDGLGVGVRFGFWGIGGWAYFWRSTKV